MSAYQQLFEARRAISDAEIAGLMKGVSSGGFNRATRELNALQEVRVTEAMELLASFREGRVDPDLMIQAYRPRPSEYAWRELNRLAPHVFTETMTLSDFDSLTTTVMNRSLLDKWTNRPQVWRNFCKVRNGIKDFRVVDYRYLDGGEAKLNKRSEMAPHERRTVTDGYKQYSVEVYEGGFGWDWETVVNDDLNMFSDLPDRLVTAANRTVELAVGNIIADANGPHASVYTSGNANIVTSNPALSIAGLQTALGILRNKRTSDGTPINIEQVILVVADGNLYTYAQHLKNMLQFNLTTPATSNSPVYEVRNWMMPQFDVIQMPELLNIVTTNAATSWWLFARPSSLPRPFIEVGFLRGFDSPQLFRKTPNTERLGGGIAPEMGDFETFEHQIKVVLAFGTLTAFYEGGLASNGTGS